MCPDRKRRSCATIASCHAMSRARSVAASRVPKPDPTIPYGFISVPRFFGSPSQWQSSLGPPAVLVSVRLQPSCASRRRNRSVRRDSDRTGEYRPYEQSAGRAVSVPSGIDANSTDRQGCRSLRFAQPTPPWRRLVSNEGLQKHVITVSREP